MFLEQKAKCKIYDHEIVGAGINVCLSRNDIDASHYVKSPKLVNVYRTIHLLKSNLQYLMVFLKLYPQNEKNQFRNVK